MMNPYYRSWKMNPNNASAGFEFGIANADKVWHVEADRWHILGEMLTGYIKVGSFTMALKVWAPTDWRFYARVSHPTRG